MPMRAEPGVRFDCIAAAGFALLTALGTIANRGAEVVITSGTDGDHSGPLDPHKLGCAYDVRSHTFAPDAKDAFVQAVLGELGTPMRSFGGWVTEKFFGWLENEGQPGEHFHFQKRHGVDYP